MVRISEKDMQILSLLLQDARMPYTEIAKRIGVTEGAVRKRVKRLEEEGVIKGYTVVLNPKKMGYNVVAFVGFDVEPERLVSVVEEVKKWEEVRRVLITAGDHGVMLEVWCRDGGELVSFVHRLESLPGVSRVCPAMVVDEIKST